MPQPLQPPPPVSSARKLPRRPRVGRTAADWLLLWTEGHFKEISLSKSSFFCDALECERTHGELPHYFPPFQIILFKLFEIFIFKIGYDKLDISKVFYFFYFRRKNNGNIKKIMLGFGLFFAFFKASQFDASIQTQNPTKAEVKGKNCFPSDLNSLLHHKHPYRSFIFECTLSAVGWGCCQSPSRCHWLRSVRQKSSWRHLLPWKKKRERKTPSPPV